MTRRLHRLLAWPVRSIRQRLMLALMVPLGLLLIGTLPLDYRLALAPSERAYDEMLLADAQTLLDQVHIEDGRARLELVSQAERVLRADDRDTEYFAVFDGAGRRLAGDQGLMRVQAPQASGADQRDLRDVVDATVDPAGEPVRMAVLRRRIDGQFVQAQVAETLNKRHASRQQILAAMILPNVLTALVVMLVLYVATRLSLAPLEQLADGVRNRSPNDLRPLELDHRPPQELTDMLVALNRLFERVEGARDVQQRFHANVAHQLRTPLAGLRTQIELAEIEGAFAGRDDRRRRIDRALDLLGHLIDQLLSLSRAEARSPHTLAAESVDVAGLVERRSTAYVDQAVARGIDIGFQLGPTAPLRGSETLLGELIGNLVDNALRHCPAGSVVTVSCGTDARGVWVAVEDDGPGIEAPLREKVFDRFYRARPEEAEGSGLGLAIVREIAELHGAAVTIESPASGRGVLFTVRWPLRATS